MCVQRSSDAVLSASSLPMARSHVLPHEEIRENPAAGRSWPQDSQSAEYSLRVSLSGDRTGLPNDQASWRRGKLGAREAGGGGWEHKDR